MYIIQEEDQEVQTIFMFWFSTFHFLFSWDYQLQRWSRYLACVLVTLIVTTQLNLNSTQLGVTWKWL